MRIRGVALAGSALAAALVSAQAPAQSLLPFFNQSTVQTQPPSSRGENFSAGKTAAQLFSSDCTGAGCHRAPQGLGKERSVGSLAGFLREHYTNSRESAASLAGYLASLASARPEPARPAPGAKPEAKPEPAKPDPKQAAQTRQQRGRQTAAEPPKVFDIFD